ncbi:zinc finger MYM-type protein 1-like [Diabrotica undecimpunctata]|uniref:zinc finger MYM-type protein 1-like n=1 Tax=Diabrotica undecimpunctata TaxID=50387 RepID=UPI003B639FD1
MGFYDVSSGRSAQDLFEFLSTKFRKFNLHSKLVAQTYDGASVMSGEVNGLQAKIKSIAPQAMFIHCYAHVFNLVLSNACSSIQQVKVFFSTLSGFSSYFSKSTKRTQVLEHIGGNRIPSNVATRWNFTSRAVLTVNNNKDKLLETFDFIINSRDFDDKTIREAVGLKAFLEDPQNIFFLEIFSLIFHQTDTVFSILQNRNTDIVKARNLLQNTLSKIREFRSNTTYFDTIYEKLDTAALHSKRRRKGVEMTDKTQQLRQIFFEILDIIATQIEVRFCDVEKLHFFDLLNISKFPIFAKEFPHDLLKNLTTQYNIFDINQLKSELSAMYGNDIIENCASPYEMLTFFHDYDLKLCMPEVFKLLCICVVLPVTSASAERSFSALKRIKNYIRNTTGQTRLSNMAKISIEKSFIKSQDENVFIDDVIDHFAEQKSRRIPLIYKKL